MQVNKQQDFRLLLASSSPQREFLLREAGFSFEQRVPEVDETQGICSGCGPAELVSSLALRKAADVVRRLPETDHAASVVLGCDTVAECGGEILGKPQDRDHARRMLSRLSGQPHRVYSGLCLWPLATGIPKTEVAITHLQMDTLSEDALEDYLETDLWQGKAGAFGYQDGPDWLHITEGSVSNVIGLPLELLDKMLVEVSPA